MTLGAEPKKVAILIVVVVIGLVSLYMNLTGDSTSTPAARTVVSNTAPVVSPAVPAPQARARGAVQSPNGGEFRPRVLGSRPDDKADPATIDPELRLDLLAKVQAVEPIEAGRNLFQFGAAPPPATLTPIPKDVPNIPTTQPKPQPSEAAKDQPPPKPPVPPINLKYYGYKVSKADGHKEAFLLDGDDIIFAQENQTVKQRYKIVRIALGFITIEDTEAKSTETLALQDLPG